MVRQGGLFRRGETERGDGGETYFQLTQAARMPRGSQRTSFFLYSMRRFVGRRSGRRAASPCLMVHCSFSAVTRISPKLASILVFAGVETGDCGYEVLVVEDVSVWDCGSVCTRAPVCCSILLTVSPTYLNIVFSTFLRCAKVVFAHSTCASFALAIARSIPAVVEGLTWPSIRPVAGQ